MIKKDVKLEGTIGIGSGEGNGEEENKLTLLNSEIEKKLKF